MALLNKVLEEFEIPIKRVASFVTDNASNMVKLVKDVNVEQAVAVCVSEEQETAAEESSSEDENTTACELSDEENARFENSLRSLLPAVSHIRCGMRLFQEFFTRAHNSKLKVTIHIIKASAIATQNYTLNYIPKYPGNTSEKTVPRKRQANMEMYTKDIVFCFFFSMR